jgi:hypothetical protein
MIVSEHTCSRRTPLLIVKITPSVCGWLAITGFMGVHCATADNARLNMKSTVVNTRPTECESRILENLGEISFDDRDLQSAGKRWKRYHAWGSPRS